MNTAKKHILITSGPTNERIDEVMKITNFSTGRLPACIADTMLTAGHEVCYVHSRSAAMPQQTDSSDFRHILIESTADLLAVLQQELGGGHYDAIVHAAAVGDYKTRYVTSSVQLAAAFFDYAQAETALTRAGIKELLDNLPEQYRIAAGSKMSSDVSGMTIFLEQTPKIISEIKKIAPQITLVGFKLLDKVSNEELHTVALKLLKKSNANLVIANDLARIDDAHHFALAILPDGSTTKCANREEIARYILSTIMRA